MHRLRGDQCEISQCVVGLSLCNVAVLYRGVFLYDFEPEVAMEIVLFLYRVFYHFVHSLCAR